MVQPSVLTDPADVQDADLRAQVEKFQTTYQQSSGRTPQDDPIAVWAWDAAQSLVKAFEEAGSVDHAKVRDALEAQRYVGAGGVVERSKDNHSGYASSNSLLAVVRGSAIQVVKG
jgi:ABC-type branched-subunit amino acid transport system substrate-binding protein